MLTTAFPRFGGDLAGNFVFFFCRELRRRGQRVVVVTPHTPGAPVDETMEGIDVRRFRYLHPPSLQRVGYLGGTLTNLRESWLARLGLPLYALGFWLSARRLARQCRILHAHWIPCALAALASAPSGRRPPVVVSVWGSDVRLLRLPVLGRLALRLLRRAEAILAVSERMKQDLISLGLPGEKVSVVLTARTPLERPSGTPEDLRARLGLPSGRPLVLYLGRLSPVKGPHHLVDAAAEVLREAPEACFVLVGDGPLGASLQAAVRERGMQDSFVFAGFVPHDRVGHFLAAADLLVLPSLSEGLPHAVLEAMSFGLPVVASAVGGVPEVVCEGVSGHLVPPGEPDKLALGILSLLRDPERRRRLGEAGRRILEEKQLTWERFTDEVQGVYAKVLGGAAP